MCGLLPSMRVVVTRSRSVAAAASSVCVSSARPAAGVGCAGWALAAPCTALPWRFPSVPVATTAAVAAEVTAVAAACGRGDRPPDARGAVRATAVAAELDEGSSPTGAKAVAGTAAPAAGVGSAAAPVVRVGSAVVSGVVSLSALKGGRTVWSGGGPVTPPHKETVTLCVGHHTPVPSLQ